MPESAPPALRPAELTFAAGDRGVLRVDPGELGAARVTACHPGPPALGDAPAAVRDALAEPIGFPTLDLAAIPDDAVAVALSPDLTDPAAVVAGVWEELRKAGVDPARVHLVRGRGPAGGRHGGDPRGLLGRDDARAMAFTRHDAESEARLRLPRRDRRGRAGLPRPAAGRRGPGRHLRPTALRPAAGRRRHEQRAGPGAVGRGGGSEGPRGRGTTNSAPMTTARSASWRTRRAGCWARSSPCRPSPPPTGGTAAVLAGGADAVLRAGRALLNDLWRVRAAARADLALVAVAPGSADRWAATAQALDAARRLVVRGGRIVVLTDLAGSPPPGLEELSRADQPSDVLKSLRQYRPPDLLAATAWAQAADHANVLMLSGLDPDLAEDLFTVPLDSPDEVARAVSRADTVAAVGGAQFAWCEVG